MTTPSKIPVTARTNDTQIKTPASLYTAKTELESLKNDLKYVTGAKNKAEVEAKIVSLESNISDLAESKIIKKANEDNFENGMSFNEKQLSVLNNFREFAKTDKGIALLKIMDVMLSSSKEGGNDLETKNAYDNFVKTYRSTRKDILKKQDVTDLDNFVFSYEKAFGLESKPFISEQEKRESSQREASLSHKESQEFVKNTLATIRNMEQNLLEAKARAPRKILGGLDTKETQPIEDDIASLKRKLAIAVSSAASDYLGVHINYSDIRA